jgi:polysaccharide pyruvyl transferase WcaK-like protein
LFLLFVATHVPYGVGQIEGLIVHGDNELAASRPRRVALVALKNAGNKGDEAISGCVAGRLCESGGHGEQALDFYLAALGPSGFDVRPLPRGARARDLMIADMLAPSQGSRGVDNGSIRAVPRLLAVLATFRAVVIAGGQWLHDLSLAKHLAICTMFALARLFGTGTGVFCIGAGPLRSAFSRRLVRLAFSRRSIIVARDEASTSLLRECGLDQAETATDPAIELKSDHPRVGPAPVLVSPCAWSSFENLYTKDDREIEESLGRWRSLLLDLQQRGEQVAILPTMNPEDQQFAARIAAGMDAIEIVDTDRLMPAEIQAMIGAAKALVSMRLHPLVFASNAGTPFVAIAYAKKVRAFCEQSGAASRVLSLDDPHWPAKAIGLLDEPLDEAAASDARNRQFRSLDHAYSQFFRWLRLEPSRAPGHRLEAVHLS